MLMLIFCGFGLKDFVIAPEHKKHRNKTALLDAMQ
jgi:hypothetical protein